jgi:hypothetical protein
MIVNRRTFIAGMVASLAVRQKALAAPPIGAVDAVAPEIVAFHESWDFSVLAVRSRVVIVGSAARELLQREPTMWSAVMIERKLT